MTSSADPTIKTADGETPDAPYCGHFGQLTKQRFDYLFSRVAAVRAATNEKNQIGTSADPYPDIFEFTHRPITVYQTESTTIGKGGASISENEVLAELQTDHNRNFAVVIQGKVGTGKSELCSYLVHQLQDSRPILEVRKDDDLMSLLTKRIPDFYKDQFGEPFPQQTNYGEIEADLQNPAYDIPGLIVRKAIRRIGRHGHDLAEDTDASAIEKFLSAEMNVLLEAVEDDDRGSKLVTKQHYQQKEFLQIFADEAAVDRPWAVINKHLWEALMDEYNTLPLEDVLEQVGQRFQKTRPIIVFEDFSVAAVQAERIRNFIERDIAGDVWDFVIAGTTDSIGPLQTQTFQGRFPFYQTNSPGTNQVPFLTADDVVEFVRPYLAYPKSHDESIGYTEDPPSDRLIELQEVDPVSESVCAKCGLFDGALDRSLYPLTDVFIERIFDPGLQESERSPREMIRVISDVLEETYYGPTQIPSSASVLDNLATQITPADEVYDAAPEFVDLAKWYGVDDGDAWKVNRRIPMSFGLIATNETTETLPAGIELTDEAIRIPKSSVEVAVDRKEEPDSHPGRSDPPTNEEKEADEENPGEQLSRIERLIQEHRSEVDNWRNNPADDRYQDTKTYISIAIEDLINHLTTDYSIWVDSDLRYNLSDTKRPFVYANTDTDPDADQITINPRSFQTSALIRLLKHGIQLEEGAADRKDMLDRYATRFTRLASRWQTTVQTTFLNTNKVLFDTRTDFEFEDFIVSSYALLCLLEDPWKEITATRLNERFIDNTKFTLDETLEAALTGDQLSDDDVKQLETTIETAPRIESLLESRLAVSSNQLDVPAVRTRLQQEHPFRPLEALARSRIDELETRVRFSPEDKLRNIARAIHSTYATMEKLENHIQVDDYPDTVNARLEGVSVDDVAAILDTLRGSYSNLIPAEFLETLDEFTRLEESDLRAVRSGASVANQRAYTSTERIRTVLAYLKLEAHPAVRLTAEIFGESFTTQEDLAPNFQEVAEFYVD